MSRKKRPQKVSAIPAGPLPVLHGNAFVTMLDEARGICNELAARREFDSDVVEYLRQKGLLEEWGKWREAKRGAQPG